jgi:hypothetical protein
MAGTVMDGQGNIGLAYSFSGTTHYPGQRITGRLDGDPLGVGHQGGELGGEQTTVAVLDYLGVKIIPDGAPLPTGSTDGNVGVVHNVPTVAVGRTRGGNQHSLSDAEDFSEDDFNNALDVLQKYVDNGHFFARVEWRYCEFLNLVRPWNYVQTSIFVIVAPDGKEKRHGRRLRPVQ